MPIIGTSLGGIITAHSSVNLVHVLAYDDQAYFVFDTEITTVKEDWPMHQLKVQDANPQEFNKYANDAQGKTLLVTYEASTVPTMSYEITGHPLAVLFANGGQLQTATGIVEFGVMTYNVTRTTPTQVNVLFSQDITAPIEDALIFRDVNGNDLTRTLDGCSAVGPTLIINFLDNQPLPDGATWETNTQCPITFTDGIMIPTSGTVVVP